MLADGFGFHRLECSGPDMQCEFAPGDSSQAYFIKHSVCKMQTGGRSRYGAFYARVDGLVVLCIGILRGAVKIGRNRYFPDR